MDEEYTIECQACNWTGNSADLVCSDEDMESKKHIEEIPFNKCPDCGSVDMEDIE